MDVKYNVTGERRKELVGVISEITESPTVYKGAPTFAYEIGGFTIDKEGTLSSDSITDNELVEKLLANLSERGFECEKPSDGLVIEIPLDGFTEESISNLQKLIASKTTLIKKSLGQSLVDGADTFPVVRTETTLKFPWFSSDTSVDEVAAYSRLIGALCAMAKVQKRVNARAKPVANEKFAFRVFLIRLGFVGDEYKTARKILLKNLSGNSAFKNGAPPKVEVPDE